MRKLALLLLLPMCLAAVSCSSAEDTANGEPVVAKISTTPFIIADMQTTIVASESTGDAELSYSYDTDGDGTFESIPETMDQSKLSWTFTEPGPQKVSVKIETRDGQTDVATAEFIVYPADYLNADKKSELAATLKPTGEMLTLDIQALPVDSTATLRVYSNGANANTASPEDIKVLGPWTLTANQNGSFQVDVKDLPGGKYEATIASSTGAERHVSFTVR